jgi:Flp pilus assembly protein TadD
MRRYWSICFALVLAARLQAPCQESQSLGDIARAARQQRQKGPPAAADPLPASDTLSSKPVTKIQLFAWLTSQIETEDIVRELRSRGIGFEPDGNFIHDFTAAGAESSLLSELHKAARHPANDSTETETLQAVVTAALDAHQKNFSEAMRPLRDALKKDPNNPDLYFALGGLMRETEDSPGAVWALTRSVQLAPAFAPAHGQLSYAYFRSQESEKAITEARVMLKLHPDSAEGHKLLGLAFASAGDDDTAMREYQTALNLRPDYANVYYDIGQVHARAKNWPLAISFYQRALDLGRSNWYYYNQLGIALGRAGRIDEAVAVFKKGIAFDSSRPEIRQSYGALLCNNGRYREAVVAFRELLQLEPDWNMARPCLYRSLMSIGQTAEAEKVKQDYIEHDPNHESW